MVELQIRDGDPYLVNCHAPDSKKSWEHAGGLPLCYWWKGLWFHKTDANDVLEPYDVPFQISDTTDCVFVGTKIMSIGDVLDARLHSKPAANCCILYHDAKEEPTDADPGFQTFTVKHRMIWKPNKDAPVVDKGTFTTMDIKHAAGAVPTAKWLKSDIV
eukprot:7967624-Karenia_brevis.AAC.1